MTTRDNEIQKIIIESLQDVFSNKKLRYSFQVISLLQSKLNGQGRRLVKSKFDRILADQVRTLYHFFLSLHGSGIDCFESFNHGWREFIEQISLCCVLFPDCTKDFCQSGNILFEQEILLNHRLMPHIHEWISIVVKEVRFNSTLKEFMALLLERSSEEVINILVGHSYRTSLSQLYSDSAADKVKTLLVPEFACWVKGIESDWENIVRANCGDNTSVMTATLKHIKHGLRELLVIPFKDFLFNSGSGCASMARRWNFDALSQFVEFYSDMCCDDEIEKTFDKVVKEKIDEILSVINNPSECNPSRGVEMTIDVLERSTKLFSLIGKEFEERNYVLTLNQGGFVEAVSTFYDRSVKKMKLDDRLISNIAKLYSLVVDEDALDRVLKKSMSARLAQAEPIHLGVERAFLASIPEKRVAFECMITDVEKSWQISSKFVKSFQSEEGGLGFSFRATVFRGGSLLPLTASSPKLADEMADCESRFMNFYSLLHNGRRLVFLRHLGKVQFELHHGGKSYMITAPTPFASTILSFNDRKSLSISVICEKNGLEPPATQRQLRKLCDCGLVVEEDSEYKFKEDFCSASAHIVIDGTSHSRGGEDSTAPAIDSNRMSIGTIIETVIVKAIKECSPLSHKDLSEKVYHGNQRSFLISPANLKASIQNLMERGLITRTTAGYIFQP